MLEVKQSLAIKLFESFGFQLAKHWDCDKLTKRINMIEEEPDEPLGSEELDQLMDDLLDAEETIVVPDDGNIETSEKEERTKMAKKTRKDMKKKKVKREKVQKKAKEKKARKPKKASLDKVTFELISGKGMSMDGLVNALVKKFPEYQNEKKRKTLENTTKRRLTGHLQKKFNVKIVKSKTGVYRVA